MAENARERAYVHVCVCVCVCVGVSVCSAALVGQVTRRRLRPVGPSHAGASAHTACLPCRTHPRVKLRMCGHTHTHIHTHMRAHLLLVCFLPLCSLTHTRARCSPGRPRATPWRWFTAASATCWRPRRRWRTAPRCGGGGRRRRRRHSPARQRAALPCVGLGGGGARR